MRLNTRNFNPRTCVRCDNLSSLSYKKTSTFQSTHLCEVRPDGQLICVFGGIFQSTHLCEVRPDCGFCHEYFMDFNPRTCVRCDDRLIKRWCEKQYFNPRTCVRCDKRLLPWPDAVYRISIHAPV